MGVLTAVHLVAHHAFSVLNRYTALCLGHPYNKYDNRKEKQHYSHNSHLLVELPVSDKRVKSLRTA